MKKLYLLIVLLTCFLLPYKITLAANNIAEIFPEIPLGNYADSLILSVGSDKALVDGQLKVGADIKIRNGVVWLPLRFTAENLGWQINYAKGNVTLEHSGQKIQLQTGNVNILLNGQARKIAATPYEENNVLWLPLRAIAETLGKQVDWQENYHLYYSSPYQLPHSLILLYDKDSNFPNETNTAGINHLYDCYLSLLYNETEIVFADKYITVFLKDEQLFLQDLYYADFQPEILNNSALPVINSQTPDVIDKSDTFTNGVCFWQETANGWLMRRNESTGWDLRGRTTLYYLDNKDIRQANWRYLTEEINFAALQVFDNGVLALRHFDNDDIWDYNETNLAYYDFATGQKYSIGTPGYFYGFDLAGNPQPWQIENDKITIFGYNRRLDTPKQQKQASYMQYSFTLP